MVKVTLWSLLLCTLSSSNTSKEMTLTSCKRSCDFCERRNVSRLCRSKLLCRPCHAVNEEGVSSWFSTQSDAPTFHIKASGSARGHDDVILVNGSVRQARGQPDAHKIRKFLQNRGSGSCVCRFRLEPSQPA